MFSILVYGSPNGSHTPFDYPNGKSNPEGYILAPIVIIVITIEYIRFSLSNLES